MNRTRQAAFALVCLAQIAVPVSLIVKHEQTRTSGTVWKFQTAPVDPGDPFRGRYVQLAFAAERAPVPLASPGEFAQYNQRMYAELVAGPDGFARLVRLHAQRPAGVDYIDVFAQQMFIDETSRQPGSDHAPQGPPANYVHVPFDRYYLPEARAPEVEREYWEASRKAQANTWAEVRVRDGHAVLVNLVLDGKPVL